MGNTPKIRDKEITSRRLISAVGSLLAKKGFKGLGVNAVAREAGVDKVLIYRYFDGLPGLIAAFAREGNFWPSTLELAGGDMKRFARLPLERRLEEFAANFIQALKSRPITRAVMAWEMVEPNELTRALEQVRERGIQEFYQIFFTKEGGNHLKEAIALAGAAIQYLIIRSNHIDVFGGLDLNNEAGWKEIQNTLALMIRGVPSPV